MAGSDVSAREGAGFLRGYSPAVLGLIALLAAMVIPPLIYLVMASFHETNFDSSFGDFTLDNYTNLVGGERFWRHFANTCIYSFGSAFLALVIGGAQAWIVERTNTPGRSMVLCMAIVALGIPSVLFTISLLLIFGKAGPVNQILMAAFGAREAVLDVYSL